MFAEFFSGIDWQLIAILIGSVGLVLAFEFVNGFHDTANAVATVIFTKSMKPGMAVFLSGIFNFLGVAFGGLAVAYAIVNLLPMELLATANSTKGLVMIFSLLIAALIWNLGTWFFGIPASSSHALIGSILGVGLANALIEHGSLVEGVNWHKAWDVFFSLLFSPIIGAGIAGLFMILLLKWKPKSNIHKTPHIRHNIEKKKRPPFWPRFCLVCSAMGMSFAHGQNDGQKGIGLVMLVLFSIVPAQFVVNMNSNVYDIQQTKVAAQLIVTSYDKNKEVMEQIFPKPMHEMKTLFSCEPSEMVKHADKLVGLLNGITSYSQLDTDQRWAVRNEVLCLGNISKKLEHADELSSADRQTYKSISKDLTKTTQYAPIWVILAVAVALGCGTMIGWRRVVNTVGGKIGKKEMTYAQGMSAQITAGVSIASASYFGLPVSTTHILSSAVAGTMVANKSGLQASTVRSILMAWVLTLPVSIILAFGLYYIGNHLFI